MLTIMCIVLNVGFKYVGLKRFSLCANCGASLKNNLCHGFRTDNKLYLIFLLDAKGTGKRP